MSSRSSRPAQRPVTVALCLMLACVGVALIATATADAAQYKMVLCAANNGSNSFATETNTRSPQNPGGIFNFENYCGPAPDPAGDQAFLRIAENQSGGNAGQWAYGSINYDAPPNVHFKTAGGYTRQPGAFNDGWRTRFWSPEANVEFLLQGAGAPTPISNTFGPHLWPWGHQLDFRRFTIELLCVRAAGCDRANFNAVDANSFVFVLSDDSNSHVILTDGSPLMGGQWVRGTHTATYRWSEQGSGIRFERVRIDGAERFSIDHIAAGQCNADFSHVNGVFARTFAACPTANDIGRTFTFDTATLADGAHTLQACTQDFAQWQGLNGTSSESCDARTIRVDNSAPGAPSGLQVTSANPKRYLDRFGAVFLLPPNQGSPIAKVHYNVENAAGEVVKPTQTLNATNPTALTGIEGPKAPGAYRLRVWLEDQVGYVGPAATAEIPRDTVPPAAPQDLRVVAESSARRVERFGVRWQNVIDGGSPIDAAYYQFLDASGEALGTTRTVSGKAIEVIPDLQTPPQGDPYAVRLWLSDEEGNVGAAAHIAVPRDTTPPAAPECQLARSSARRICRPLLRHGGLWGDWHLAQDGGCAERRYLSLREPVDGRGSRRVRRKPMALASGVPIAAAVGDAHPFKRRCPGDAGATRKRARSTACGDAEPRRQRLVDGRIPTPGQLGPGGAAPQGRSRAVSGRRHSQHPQRRGAGRARLSIAPACLLRGDDSRSLIGR
jgi:hypothetical protein